MTIPENLLLLQWAAQTGSFTTHLRHDQSPINQMSWRHFSAQARAAMRGTEIQIWNNPKLTSRSTKAGCRTNSCMPVSRSVR